MMTYLNTWERSSPESGDGERERDKVTQTYEAKSKQNEIIKISGCNQRGEAGTPANTGHNLGFGLVSYLISAVTLTAVKNKLLLSIQTL